MTTLGIEIGLSVKEDLDCLGTSSPHSSLYYIIVLTTLVIDIHSSPEQYINNYIISSY